MQCDSCIQVCCGGATKYFGSFSGWFAFKGSCQGCSEFTLISFSSTKNEVAPFRLFPIVINTVLLCYCCFIQGCTEIKSRSLFGSLENRVTFLLEAGRPIFTHHREWSLDLQIFLSDESHCTYLTFFWFMILCETYMITWGWLARTIPVCFWCVGEVLGRGEGRVGEGSYSHCWRGRALCLMSLLKIWMLSWLVNARVVSRKVFEVSKPSVIFPLLFSIGTHTFLSNIKFCLGTYFLLFKWRSRKCSRCESLEVMKSLPRLQ